MRKCRIIKIDIDKSRVLIAQEHVRVSSLGRFSGYGYKVMWWLFHRATGLGTGGCNLVPRGIQEVVIFVKEQNGSENLWWCFAVAGVVAGGNC